MPVLQNGKPHPGAVRQISSGSILGNKWICTPTSSVRHGLKKWMTRSSGWLRGEYLFKVSCPCNWSTYNSRAGMCIYKYSLLCKLPLTFNSGPQHMA
jgi:hypothetical protein